MSSDELTRCYDTDPQKDCPCGGVKDKPSCMYYQNLQQKLEASIRKNEAQQRAIRAKREEKRNVKRAGGGHAIARSMLTRGGDHDTDFNYGANAENVSGQRVDSDELGQNSSDRCMGSVACKRCGKFHGYCAEVQEQKEKINMLPTDENTQTGKSNRKGGLNWIRIEDLTTVPQEAKILMVRYNEQGQWGPSVQLKVAFKGEIRYIGIKPTKKDPRYKNLLDAFGPDENNWVDARILLYAEQDKFSEGFNMRIDAEPEKPKSARGR